MLPKHTFYIMKHQIGFNLIDYNIFFNQPYNKCVRTIRIIRIIRILVLFKWRVFSETPVV